MTHRLMAALVVAACAAQALAQQEPAAPAPVSNPADYRWAIYTSCTVVFAAILVYLGVTHARAAKVSEEVSAIERRLAELEGPPSARS